MTIVNTCNRITSDDLLSMSYFYNVYFPFFSYYFVVKTYNNFFTRLDISVSDITIMTSFDCHQLMKGQKDMN